MECEGDGEMAVLDLQHCNLTSVPTDIFKAEPNLEEIYLDANQIRELPRVSSFTNQEFICVTGCYYLYKLSSHNVHL